MKKIYLFLLLLLFIVVCLGLYHIKDKFDAWSLSKVPEEIFIANEKFVKDVFGLEKIIPMRFNLNKKLWPYRKSYTYNSIPYLNLIDPDIYPLKYITEEGVPLYIWTSRRDGFVLRLESKLMGKLKPSRNIEELSEEELIQLLNPLLSEIGLPRDIKFYKICKNTYRYWNYSFWSVLLTQLPDDFFISFPDNWLQTLTKEERIQPEVTLFTFHLNISFDGNISYAISRNWEHYLFEGVSESKDKEMHE